MNLKYYKILIVLSTAIVLSGCAKNSTLEHNSNATTSSADETSSTEQETSENISFSKALSNEETQVVEALIVQYYETEFPYDLLSMKVADDRHYLYAEMGYDAGDIIIYVTETTHAGEGIYRHIVLVKNNGNWQCVNEGY